MTICLWYLRASTAQIITTLSPIIIFILSYFFLNEKFYIRYFYGCIICLIGSFIIILNEKNSKNIKNEKSNFNDILIGVFFCFLNVIATSLISVANKKLADNKAYFNSRILCWFNNMFLFIYIFFFLWEYLFKNRLFNYVYDTWLIFLWVSCSF